ncbi:hypothetical protein ACER0C_002701 [Sarotherodon galilaeus]
MPLGTCYALSIQSPVIAPSLNCLATGGFAPSHSKFTQPFQWHASLLGPGSPRTDVVSTTATSVPCDVLLVQMLRPGHGWLFSTSAKNTSYILVMESRSWSAAQSYCRTYHTDLTSIRSKEEKSNTTLTLNGSADMHSTEIQQQVSQQLSGLMLSEGLTDFRTRWRKVQSYRDDQSKKEDGDGGCKTED